MKVLGIAIAFVAISSTCATAMAPKLLGVHEKWSAWTFTENKRNVCYIYADAVTKKPVVLDHGRVGVSVRRLKSGKIRTEASLMAGYDFAPKTIRIAVDGKRFTMVPRGRSAWLRGTEREEEFARALSRGRRMIVEAVSRRGNKTSYDFSLKGFTAAMRLARKTCP